MPLPLGHTNPRLRALAALQRPAGRREAGAFVAEGATLLAEAARSGLRAREIVGTAAGLARIDPGAYEAAGVPVYAVDDRAFARISDVETPSGVLGVFAIPSTPLDAVMAAAGPVLVLAAVADPGNAGTLVRSADAFGAAGVVFGAGGADPWGSKVVRGAMGSLFRVPVAVADADAVLVAAAAAGRPVIAATIDGEPLAAGGLPANAVLTVGNERRGVADWLPRWDRAVTIPQRGDAESLNAAVAGSILLYECARAVK